MSRLRSSLWRESLNQSSTATQRGQHGSVRWSRPRRSAGGREAANVVTTRADNRGPRDHLDAEALTQAERTGISPASFPARVGEAL